MLSQRLVPCMHIVDRVDRGDQGLGWFVASHWTMNDVDDEG